MTVLQQTAMDRTTPDLVLRIGRERRATGSGGSIEHVSPATGQVDAIVPLAGAQEFGQVVGLADEAASAWAATRPAERGRLLLALADLVEHHAAEFARRGTLDNGTPISVTRGGAGRAAEWIRYYAGWADKLTSEVVGGFGSGEFSYTLCQPYGVVGAIITWNAPLISLAMKVPAALAAGNAVVVKPSELTPFSGDLFIELAEQAGLPTGVLSILPGDAAAGAALVADRRVQKISFTGGFATAQRILQACAPQMKPAVLELGGKSANIVFADADLDKACAHGARYSLAMLSGQGCSLGTRMLVDESVYDQVVERVAALAKDIVVGDPFDPRTMSGPVVTQSALERILAMVARARLDGALLVAGGARLGGELASGYYIEPTVFADVRPDSELAQAEVFGPVLAITPFTDEEHAVQIANSTQYGLTAYISTQDIERAMRMAERLDVGEVLINRATNVSLTRPFGGRRLSGVGKEGGRQGIEEFLRTKAVGVAQWDAP
jgi:aldehyde dehydrogenase (NAD+)